MNKKFYIETFGCQMNVADSEVVASVLNSNGFQTTDSPENADIYLINTCAVRENAEKRIWNKLEHIKGLKKKRKNLKLGILGCMAQHIGNKFKDSGVVDFVAGPDSYRKLPDLIKKSYNTDFSSELELSTTETYESILPARIQNSTTSGFVSITRGCNNFCTYCIVPYTRGRERSRDSQDIFNEIRDLRKNNYKEITLLGQNVNSYKWNDTDFPALISKVAKMFPEMRIRFTTSHPKDISDELIYAIAGNGNICNHIHLPVQSGSNMVLKKMNRKYTRESYLERIDKIKKNIPDCSITTDIFAGFPGESHEDHKESLSLMREVTYDSAFMFKYSERSGTYAAKHMKDDIPEDIKTQRLNELIELQNKLSERSNSKEPSKIYEVMIEGKSKRNKTEVFGRTCQNKVVIIPDNNFKPGDKVNVKIESYTSATLFGKEI